MLTAIGRWLIRATNWVLEPYGIIINGSRPYDLQMKPERWPFILLALLFRDGSLVLGEAYMRGEWSSADLPETLRRLLQIPRSAWNIDSLKRWLDRQLHPTTIKDAYVVGRQHYDLSPWLYEGMLGKATMLYSCGIFPKGADPCDLTLAQRTKCEVLCTKLRLQPGMLILDIGCGWGSLALHLARYYGVYVVGITVSEQQANYARAKAKAQGLSGKVAIHHLDYRELYNRLRHSQSGRGLLPTGYRCETGAVKFDRVVSVGMFEHVGREHYAEYMHIVGTILKENGLFLLHTIVSRRPAIDAFFWKYIFPNSRLPAKHELLTSSWPVFGPPLDIERIDGHHYAATLRCWLAHLQKKSLRMRICTDLGEETFRMLNFHLAGCIPGFEDGTRAVYHVLLAGQDFDRRAYIEERIPLLY